MGHLDLGNHPRTEYAGSGIFLLNQYFLANCHVLSNYLAISSLIFVNNLSNFWGSGLSQVVFIKKGVFVFVAVAFFESSGRTFTISVTRKMLKLCTCNYEGFKVSELNPTDVSSCHQHFRGYQIPLTEMSINYRPGGEKLWE